MAWSSTKRDDYCERRRVGASASLRPFSSARGAMLFLAAILTSAIASEAVAQSHHTNLFNLRRGPNQTVWAIMSRDMFLMFAQRGVGNPPPGPLKARLGNTCWRGVGLSYDAKDGLTAKQMQQVPLRDCEPPPNTQPGSASGCCSYLVRYGNNWQGRCGTIYEKPVCERKPGGLWYPRTTHACAEFWRGNTRHWACRPRR